MEVLLVAERGPRAGPRNRPRDDPATGHVAGLRRLKLARVRRIALETCQTARTQRWSPEDLLRTLIEAELAVRDESNHRLRLKLAAFPVAKTLDEFKVQLSSLPHF